MFFLLMNLTFVTLLSGVIGYLIGSRGWTVFLRMNLNPGPLLGALIGIVTGLYAAVTLWAIIYTRIETKNPTLHEKLKNVSKKRIALSGILLTLISAIIGYQIFNQLP